MAEPSPLDPFIPNPDIQERFHTTIKAPANLVMDVAGTFDLESVAIVRGIIRMRERILGTTPRVSRKPQGLLADTRAMGWGLLAEHPGRLIVCGATCQPWQANVRFTPIAADRFASYSEPSQVKIAWTIESEPLDAAVTRFVQETRAVATDADAHARFRSYWGWARFGIIGIRLFLLPAIRREAERRWAALSRQMPGAIS